MYDHKVKPGDQVFLKRFVGGPEDTLAIVTQVSDECISAIPIVGPEHTGVRHENDPDNAVFKERVHNCGVYKEAPWTVKLQEMRSWIQALDAKVRALEQENARLFAKSTSKPSEPEKRGPGRPRKPAYEQV